MRAHSLVLALAAATAIRPAAAQSRDDVIAFQALVSTPVGALPPMATRTMIGTMQQGASIAVRYGYLGAVPGNGSSGNNFAATVILPAGLGSSLSLTAGAVSQYCGSRAGCGSKLMLGGAGDMRLWSSAMDRTAASPKLTVSLTGELGYAQRSPGSFISGYVGVPVALVGDTRPNRGLQLVGFLTPGFGFANITGAGAANGSGSRYMLGGGVGMFNTASSVMVDAGFQYVGIDNGKTLFGIGVILGR